MKEKIDTNQLIDTLRSQLYSFIDILEQLKIEDDGDGEKEK